MYYADRTDGDRVPGTVFAVDDDGFASLGVNYAGRRRPVRRRQSPHQGWINPFPQGHVDPFGDQGNVSAGYLSGVPVSANTSTSSKGEVGDSTVS